jgi:3-phosphoshikimate 1-carboxyvinyltransferase
MSFAIAALAVDGIAINDPACVSKTFPDFFQCWGRLTEGGPTDVV